MKKETEISIILPNYNSYEYVDKTIKSILNQSYKNWKLLIVDDCSNSKTRKILKKYLKNKKIKILWLKKNKGAAYCRNLALKKIKSPYVAFIDSDDLWKKNKLKFQINFMKKNNIMFSYTNYETFDLKFKFIKPPEKFTFLEFTKNTSIGTSTMMLNRKIIKNAKFTNTKICEDYYFKCKILKYVGKAHCLKKYLTKYRIRVDSLQSNNLVNFFWIWKINRDYNNFNILENMISLFFISFNSLKKYGLKSSFN